MQKWPFEDPPDVAVLTTKAVLDGGWIFQVSRDDDDGMWEFHTPHGNAELSEEDGRIVSLESMWRHDPSVAEVADLAPGWVAWRDAVGRPWRRDRARRRLRSAGGGPGPRGRGGRVELLSGFLQADNRRRRN